MSFFPLLSFLIGVEAIALLFLRDFCFFGGRGAFESFRESPYFLEDLPDPFLCGSRNSPFYMIHTHTHTHFFALHPVFFWGWAEGGGGRNSPSCFFDQHAQFATSPQGEVDRHLLDTTT